MKLSDRIRLIRLSFGLTQADVAFKCGISTSAYGHIERNATKSSYETLDKIANAIGVKTSFLLDIDNNKISE